MEESPKTRRAKAVVRTKIRRTKTRGVVIGRKRENIISITRTLKPSTNLKITTLLTKKDAMYRRSDSERSISLIKIGRILRRTTLRT